MTVLVVLGIYPDIGFLGEIEKRIDSIYIQRRLNGLEEMN